MVKEVKYYLWAASKGAVFFYADMSVGHPNLGARWLLLYVLYGI